MRSFISTPPFHLLVVIINISLLFPVVGFGFSSANLSSASEDYQFQADSLSRKFWSFQFKHFEKLGVLRKEKNNQNKPPLEKQKQQSQETESGTNFENGVTQENLIQSATPTKTEATIETVSVNKTQKDKFSTVPGEPKLPARKSFSDVKNLPDAERLRTTTPKEPQIPASVSSTECLISTINCPSDKKS